MYSLIQKGRPVGTRHRISGKVGVLVTLATITIVIGMTTWKRGGQFVGGGVVVFHRITETAATCHHHVIHPHHHPRIYTCHEITYLTCQMMRGRVGRSGMLLTKPLHPLIPMDEETEREIDVLPSPPSSLQICHSPYSTPGTEVQAYQKPAGVQPLLVRTPNSCLWLPAFPFLTWAKRITNLSGGNQVSTVTILLTAIPHLYQCIEEKCLLQPTLSFQIFLSCHQGRNHPRVTPCWLRISSLHLLQILNLLQISLLPRFPLMSLLYSLSNHCRVHFLSVSHL
jgi:hypothetical protein